MAGRSVPTAHAQRQPTPLCLAGRLIRTICNLGDILTKLSKTPRNRRHRQGRSKQKGSAGSGMDQVCRPTLGECYRTLSAHVHGQSTNTVPKTGTVRELVAPVGTLRDVRLARGAIQGLHRLGCSRSRGQDHSVRIPDYPQNRTLTRSGSISLLLFLKRGPVRFRVVRSRLLTNEADTQGTTPRPREVPTATALCSPN
jgi:hypothetical protein